MPEKSPTGELESSLEISADALANARQSVNEHIQNLRSNWETTLSKRDVLTAGEESLFHGAIDEEEGQNLRQYLRGKERESRGLHSDPSITRRDMMAFPDRTKEGTAEFLYIKRRLVSWAWDIAAEVSAGREGEVRSKRLMSQDRLLKILEGALVAMEFFDEKELPDEDKACIRVEVKKALAKMAELELEKEQQNFDSVLKKKLEKK